MKRPAAKLVLLVFSLALALVGAEWLVRAFSIGPEIFSIQRGMVRLSPDPRLRYELVPGYISPRMDVMVNRWGMRNPSIDQEKPPDTWRIACIGDSIAFGMGAGQNDHFGPRLQNLLDAQFPDRHPAVLNFGVPGYNLDQVVAVLEQRVHLFDPDIVLYLYCLNDVQETSRELESLLRHEGTGDARRDYVERLWTASDSVLGRSKLWLLIRYHIALRRASPTRSEPYQDEVDQLLAGEGRAYVDALYQRPESRRRLELGFQAMADWQNQTGVPVWVLIFPVFSDLDDERFAAIHHEVRLAAESRGLKVIDLLDVYRGEHQPEDDAPLNADPLHPNARGYARAAEYIEPFLREVLP
jgi:lysophospholipase L1-like esterase